MMTSHKVGLGFVAAGLIGGVLIGALDLQTYRAPIYIGIGGSCFVTVFVLALREQLRKREQEKLRP
jgi:hypothetical protein